MSDAEEFWKRNRSEKAQRKIRKQAKLYGVDHKALNILWNSVEDLDAFDPALTKYLEPPAEDVAYATAQGLIHPPRTLTHDEIIAELQNVVRSIDREAIAGAFAASLKSGRLDFQSALGSYAFHLHHPTHAPQIEVYGVRSHLRRCTVCRLGGVVDETTYQIVRLPLSRMAGGGIQTRYASYALGDLLSFQEGEVLEP